MKKTLLVLLSVVVLAAAKPAPRVITVKVTAGDFQPSVVKVAKGESVRLKFIRIADPSCGTSVAIPSLKVKKELPLNQPVFVDVKADKNGEIAFTCGMGMMEGQIVVE
jgi:plastocyanin domain-containing protein